MKTLIGIQDEYIGSVVAAAGRWGHRRCSWDKTRPGGHFARIRRGAHNKAMRNLASLGFDTVAAEKIIADASDMAKLEMIAE